MFEAATARSGSHVTSLFPSCSALIVIIIFPYIWLDFLIVFGYGVWHFWSIDVDDSETVVATCVNMQVLKYIAVI